MQKGVAKIEVRDQGQLWTFFQAVYLITPLVPMTKSHVFYLARLSGRQGVLCFEINAVLGHNGRSGFGLS